MANNVKTNVQEGYFVRHGRNGCWDVIDSNTGLIISRNGSHYKLEKYQFGKY